MARIGILQAPASSGKEQARKAVVEVLTKSRVEADIIVMPEYLMMDPTGLGPKELASIAEPLDGPWVRWIEGLSREYGACIVASMFERGDGKPYNTVIVARDGELVYSYRKTHLFDALGYKESTVFNRGEEPPGTVDCGMKIGTIVCFEIRFPELTRRLVLEGAEVIVVPAAWYRGDGKEEALRFLAQARAHENTVYVTVSALYGDRFTGRSMLINPMGIVVQDLGHGVRYVEADVDRGEISEARHRLPLLRLRRRELYTI
ncbi:MAG: carbon-nitrogen hydrolase family protein [Desulfurococcales archaeon]|nr:carbon-nitrogen hydrolase family protein [Desulfurococcales archaeon]